MGMTQVRGGAGERLVAAYLELALGVGAISRGRRMFW